MPLSESTLHTARLHLEYPRDALEGDAPAPFLRPVGEILVSCRDWLVGPPCNPEDIGMAQNFLFGVVNPYPENTKQTRAAYLPSLPTSVRVKEYEFVRGASGEPTFRVAESNSIGIYLDLKRHCSPDALHEILCWEQRAARGAWGWPQRLQRVLQDVDTADAGVPEHGAIPDAEDERAEALFEPLVPHDPRHGWNEARRLVDFRVSRKAFAGQCVPALDLDVLPPPEVMAERERARMISGGRVSSGTPPCLCGQAPTSPPQNLCAAKTPYRWRGLQFTEQLLTHINWSCFSLCSKMHGQAMAGVRGRQT